MRSLLVFCMLCILVSAERASAQNSLSIVDSSAVPGSTSAPVPVLFVNDSDIQGFSLAGTYSPGPLNLTGVDFSGTAVLSEIGAEPDFANLSVDDVVGVFTLGVIFETQPSAPVQLTPRTTGSALVNLLFDVEVTAQPGDYAVTLENGLGTPPVNNILSSNGETLMADLTSGTLTIQNLCAFRLRDVTVQPGNEFDVIVECTNEDPMSGFTLSVAYNRSLLTHVPLFSGEASCTPGVTPQDTLPQYDCTDLATALGPNQVELIILQEESNVAPNMDWFSMAVLFDFCAPFDGHFLPIGEDQELLRLRFQSNGSIPLGTSTVLDLTNDFGVSGNDPTTNLAVTTGGQGIIPLLTDGTVNFADTSIGGFRRGDTNGNGTLGIEDAIAALNYLFLGTTPVNCLDTADLNDDGGLDITDVIYFLNFFFLGGCPPELPYPDCGPDQNDTDLLDCASYTSC